MLCSYFHCQGFVNPEKDREFWVPCYSKVWVMWGGRGSPRERQEERLWHSPDIPLWKVLQGLFQILMSLERVWLWCYKWLTRFSHVIRLSLWPLLRETVMTTRKSCSTGGTVGGTGWLYSFKVPPTDYLIFQKEGCDFAMEKSDRTHLNQMIKHH